MHDAHIPSLKGHNIYSPGQRPMKIKNFELRIKN